MFRNVAANPISLGGRERCAGTMPSCWSRALVVASLAACSRGSATQEIAARPEPVASSAAPVSTAPVARAEPPPRVTASPAVLASARPGVGEIAWGSLRWGMDYGAVLAALARDGVRVTKKDEDDGGAWKAMTPTVSVAGEGFTGTIYVEAGRGLTQVLLFSAETPTDAAARAALDRMTKARGAPAHFERRDQHSWWNAKMAVGIVVGSPEEDDKWFVSEHHVVDKRAERAGVLPQFDAMNGWGQFTWGARPEEMTAWLQAQGIKLDEIARSGDPGPNAPIDDDPGLRVLDFEHDGGHTSASFKPRAGLVQVMVGKRFGSAAEAEKVVAERVKRFGPAIDVELRKTHRWKGKPTTAELSVVQRVTKGAWSYSEQYLPGER